MIDVIKFIGSNMALFIALFSLLISLFVAYNNFSKPYKLHVFIGKRLFWVFGDGKLRFDVLMIFYNSGMREGLIDKLKIELIYCDKIINFTPSYLYKIDKTGTYEIEDIWRPIILLGKNVYTKMVGFESDFSIDQIEKEKYETKAKLIVYYKKRLKRKNIKVQEIQFCEELIKDHAIGRSKSYKQRLAQLSKPA